MRSDASIKVTCDHPKCREEIEIQLTSIARGGYDERNVDRELKSNDWQVKDGQDLCPFHRDEDES